MMRRFFIALFVLSLIATAGAYYWRTYQPEVAVTAAPEGGRTFSPGDQEAGPEARSFRVERVPSDRQDLAVTISIWSSVISAIAAILQTWLTARAIRR